MDSLKVLTAHCLKSLQFYGTFAVFPPFFDSQVLKQYKRYLELLDEVLLQEHKAYGLIDFFLQP